MVFQRQNLVKIPSAELNLWKDNGMLKAAPTEMAVAIHHFIQPFFGETLEDSLMLFRLS